jgi:uncharacterized protein YqeY
MRCPLGEDDISGSIPPRIKIRGILETVMKIVSTITAKIGEAMKAHDEIRLSTLRMLSSALNYEFIAKQHELSDDEELVVVRHEAKMRKDAIEAYEKAGAKDRADKEKEELAILEEYLPKQMSDEELQKLVEEAVGETGAQNSSDMGRVIGVVMAKAKGQADGARVSALAKQKLIKG